MQISAGIRVGLVAYRIGARVIQVTVSAAVVKVKGNEFPHRIPFDSSPVEISRIREAFGVVGVAEGVRASGHLLSTIATDPSFRHR